LNIEALRKFGSLEIRALRGVTDPELIVTWVEILRNIYELSGTFSDPREVCEGFSGSGGVEYFEKVIGKNASRVRSDLNWTYQDIFNSLHEGIRLAQDLCYCREWALYQPEEAVIDPFGREINGLLEPHTSSLSAYAEYLTSAQVSTGLWAAPATFTTAPLNGWLNDSGEPVEDVDVEALFENYEEYDDDEDV
jgi:hypothetical protein